MEKTRVARWRRLLLEFRREGSAGRRAMERGANRRSSEAERPARLSSLCGCLHVEKIHSVEGGDHVGS